MSEKNINFNDKKVRKGTLYKNKKICSIDDTDVNNILVSKKESYGTKNLLNTLLDTMIMTSLDHYV